MEAAALEFPIIIEKLNWTYGDRPILHEIQLKIEKNRFYSIIGPNGSGKTTLLKNISRTLEPRKNTIFVDQQDIVSMKPREVAKRMASVPQNTHVDFEFSAADIVMMGRSPYLRRFQTESAKDMEIVKAAMMATSTWHLKDKNINEISGGERQRVIIARALAQQTGIILLDEPISQLDIHHQIELMDTVHRLVRKSEVTVVAVLHDLNLAAQYSDRLILVSEGSIAIQGTPEEVLTEENIQRVYQLPVHIIKSPVTGKPHVIPISAVNE